MIRTILVAALAGLALAGCGTSEVPGRIGPNDATARSAPTPVADPTGITIPAIDAHSTLEPLGLDDTGKLAVPPVDQPMQASWYAGAKPDESGDEIQPGETGPAVIAGHVDGVIDGKKGQPGIFARLHELKPGDEILIDRGDGTQARFLTDRVEKHAKDDFPTQAVYGATPVPTLRLITCGGEFDRSTGHYEDNWVAFATLAA